MCLVFLSLRSIPSAFLLLILEKNKGKIEEENATSGKNWFWSIAARSTFMNFLVREAKREKEGFQKEWQSD